VNRDVTKFEFDKVQTSNVFKIRNSLNDLSALMSNANLWKNPCSMIDFIWYAVHRQPESTDKLFPKFNLSHKLTLLNVQHDFCSLKCYTVLIWTPILWKNNIVTLLFNWSKPEHYVPTDKINASIGIRICIRLIVNLQLWAVRTQWQTASYLRRSSWTPIWPCQTS